MKPFILAAALAAVEAATSSIPASPEGICITFDQYQKPTGDCVKVWRAWDAHCEGEWTDDCDTV